VDRQPRRRPAGIRDQANRALLDDGATRIDQQHAALGAELQQAVAARALFPAAGPTEREQAFGMAVGLAMGAAAVGYRTSLADLAFMGALTGIPLGIAQALALPATARRRWLWAVTTPVLWGLGWTVTTLGGITVEEQFTIYGAYGAVTFAALSGLVLHGLVLREPS
jgi:hypothetical protein